MPRDTIRVYVGNLPPDANKKEIQREFERFGHIVDVWVARNPAGFAFVEFEDERDAEDAVHDTDGRELCGARVRVEIARGNGRRGGGGPPSRNGPRDDKCYECGKSGHFARDCRERGTARSGGSRGRSRSRSPPRRDSRRRSRSRSRSRSPADKSSSRRRSPAKKEKSRSPRRSASPPKRKSPRDNSRSRSPRS